MIRTTAGGAMRPSIGPATRRALRWSWMLRCAGAVSQIGAAPVLATTLHLPNIRYNYSVIEQDLATAIQEFGRNLDVKITVSSEVHGTVQGRRFEGSARDFFEQTMRDNNLEWYYDSGVLYITAAKEDRTQLLVLNPITYGRFKNVLDRLDISDARYPIRPAPGKGVVMTYGPPRYVALVEQTLAGLVAEEMSRRRPDAVLMVFRGSQTTVFQHGVVGTGNGAPPPAGRDPVPSPDPSKSQSAGRGGP